MLQRKPSPKLQNVRSEWRIALVSVSHQLIKDGIPSGWLITSSIDLHGVHLCPMNEHAGNPILPHAFHGDNERIDHLIGNPSVVKIVTRNIMTTVVIRNNYESNEHAVLLR
jgi:hypothetical protein